MQPVSSKNGMVITSVSFKIPEQITFPYQKKTKCKRKLYSKILIYWKYCYEILFLDPPISFKFYMKLNGLLLLLKKVLMKHMYMSSL